MWQGIGALVCFLFLTTTIFAQEISPSDTPVPTSIFMPSVQYDLPYPGLLPDSPLYWVKAFRDKFISIFITDPLKQAQFDLLQADKRLNAAYLLQKEKNPNEELIITTISKAENYFDDALGKTAQARKQGRSVVDFTGILTTAQAKHIEVLTGMEGSGSRNYKQNIEQSKKRVSRFSLLLAKLKQ